MIFPKIKKIARELDWYRTKDSVFGLYKGYFFTIGDQELSSKQGFKYITASTSHLTEEEEIQLKTELDANKKMLKFSTYEIRVKSIYIQFNEYVVSTKTETIYFMLDFLVDLFKKLNIPEQNNCHHCLTRENLDYYNSNNNGILLCKACFQEVQDSFSEFGQGEQAENKNYLIGFLGSIVFSLLGIIAWVLMAAYLDKLHSAMAILIAYLGIKGYQYFKGRHGKLTKYIIIFSNVLCILVANVATIIVELMKIGLSVSQSFAMFQIDGIKEGLFHDLKGNIMISFILAFFVWIWLFVQLKDEKLKIKLANKVRR